MSEEANVVLVLSPVAKPSFMQFPSGQTELKILYQPNELPLSEPGKEPLAIEYRDFVLVRRALVMHRSAARYRWIVMAERTLSVHGAVAMIEEFLAERFCRMLGVEWDFSREEECLIETT